MAAPIGSYEWTPARIDLAAGLWASGVPASRIAAELEGEVTKGAVSAKLKRLGLTKINRALPEKASVLVQRTKSHKPTALPVERPANTIPRAQRKTFMELEPHHCRYGYGDPQDKGFFFCGADVLDGTSYCPQHFRLCTHRY